MNYGHRQISLLLISVRATLRQVFLIFRDDCCCVGSLLYLFGNGMRNLMIALDIMFCQLICYLLETFCLPNCIFPNEHLRIVLKPSSSSRERFEVHRSNLGGMHFFIYTFNVIFSQLKQCNAYFFSDFLWVKSYVKITFRNNFYIILNPEKI